MGRPRALTDQQILAAARRYFLDHGAAASTTELARELGVSHTTVLNRFGSKEALLLAALGPPAEVPWLAALAAGPTEGPIRTQLVEHGRAISAYFEELQAGFSVLRSAGLRVEQDGRRKGGPVDAFHTFVAWIRRAQEAGRLAPCDAEALASTLLGAIHGRALTDRVCGREGHAGGGDHVAQLIDLLWEGIGPKGG